MAGAEACSERSESVDARRRAGRPDRAGAVQSWAARPALRDRVQVELPDRQRVHHRQYGADQEGPGLAGLATSTGQARGAALLAVPLPDRPADAAAVRSGRRLVLAADRG